MEWFIWIDGTQGTGQTVRFGDVGHARCSMGPKRLLERGLFRLKYPCLRGFNGTFLASNVTQVTVISGWNDSYGSMGLVGHAGNLALVMGSMPSPQWVPNGGWKWSFLVKNLHVGAGDSVATFGIYSHPSGCNFRL